MMSKRAAVHLFLLVAGVAAPTAAFAAVTISSASTDNMTCSAGVCTPTAATAVLNVNDLTNLLASGNVQVNTGSGNLAEQVKDILVTAGFGWTNASSLTLDAYRSVTIEQPVAVSGSGAVSLLTNDGGSGGTLSFISGGSLSFASTTNNLSLDGQAYTLAANIVALAGDIAGNPSGFYALSANYDASNDGTYGAAPIPTSFTGTFNGLGNTISKLTVHGAVSKASIGLFAYVASSGVVASLRITGANIKAKKDSLAGIIAGTNYGNVFNAFTAGRVSGATGRLGSSGFGGLVGGNGGTISNTGSSANIVATGNDNSAFADVGGLVGSSVGTVEESYSRGSATVSGTGSAATSGGLAGFNDGVLENCYATGAATIGASGDVGGLVGVNGLTIAGAYSTGVVSGGTGTDQGGSIGYDASSVNGGSVSSDYWDTKTSGITDPSQGAGNIANDPGITGKTTAQLKSGLPAGFDPSIWTEQKGVNHGLPYLINNPPQ